MDKSECSKRRRRHTWRPLSQIGLPLRADRPRRISRVRQPKDDPNPRQTRFPWPPQPLLQELLDGGDASEIHSSEMSRFNFLSIDELDPPIDSKDGQDSGNSDEERIDEGTSLIHESWSDDDDTDTDKGYLSDDPLLEDGFGNLTKWRLSDLRKEYIKHLEDESNKPKKKEKKQSKEEKLKIHNDLMEQFMKSALKKYNNEKDLNEHLCFEFVKATNASFIFEGGIKFYRHFNFEAMQANSSSCLFFAEVVPDGEKCDVVCCTLLQDNDNGRCLGCKNQGDSNLRHPTLENVYAGGHEDCAFPFLIDTDSEDDSD